MINNLNNFIIIGIVLIGAYIYLYTDLFKKKQPKATIITPKNIINSNQGLKVLGNNRETTIGSLNSGWSHLTTTAPQFYMNKSLQVNGGVSTYHNKALKMPHGAETKRLNVNDQETHIPLTVQSKHDSHIRLIGHNKPNESVYLINRNGGHFRVHSHGVGDTLHVNRDGHTFINSHNNNIPLHVQSNKDSHIRLTGHKNGNNSTYLINRNGGNFMVHNHGVGDVFQVLRNGRVRLQNNAHNPNTNDYSMEIFAPNQNTVKETSIRFHQGNKYWHQLRADNNGFRMTNGNSGGLSKLTVGQLCVGDRWCINAEGNHLVFRDNKTGGDRRYAMFAGQTKNL